MSHQKIHDYIRGIETIPVASECEDYRESIFEKLQAKYSSGYIRIYRGFSSPCAPHELGEKFFDHDLLISFSTSKSTAFSFAESAKDHESSYWGYVIRIDIPLSNVYFHYAMDDVGREHPKEKEILVNPYGQEWEIVEVIKPLTTSKS